MALAADGKCSDISAVFKLEWPERLARRFEIMHQAGMNLRIGNILWHF